MKRIFLICTASLITSITSNAQESTELPSVTIETIDGKPFDTKDLSNDGKPMIINFWATWCGPCKLELSNINEVYYDWIDETGVKLVAVSIDDSRTRSRVKPYIDTQGWEYEVYIDPNGDFRRAMNVGNPPFTFLIDGNGKVVYKHTGYSAGDEEELYEKLLELQEQEEE